MEEDTEYKKNSVLRETKKDQQKNQWGPILWTFNPPS